MKYLALLLITTPAYAWDFAQTDICTLSHREGSSEVTVIFDPAEDLFTFTITSPNGWEESPIFRLRFDGPSPLIIGTDRHTLSADSRSISASDSGFSNVLSGIAGNASMTAINGDDSLTVSTIGAADPVAAFRDCPSVPTS